MCCTKAALYVLFSSSVMHPSGTNRALHLASAALLVSRGIKVSNRPRHVISIVRQRASVTSPVVCRTDARQVLFGNITRPCDTLKPQAR